MAIETRNPATGEVLKTFDPLPDSEVDDRIARAAEAAASYRTTSFADRAGWARAAAGILDDEVDHVAAVMSTEMGKTLKAAKAETAKCATVLRFYAEHAERFLADEPADAGAVGAVRAYTRWQPLGPVLAVMPWNFPLWQAMRFAAPALMAGNVGLLKHSSNVPQTALYMEDVLARAGFPTDVLRALVVGDPTDDATDVGPLATESGRDGVAELVDEAVGKGANVVLGGAAPGGPGFFYPPTLLTGVTKDMSLYYEEVFGPVAVLHRAEDLDEALAIANDTPFGLGSNAWTTDPDEQERFAAELDAGMVFINGMTASYPELPFGGVKESGYGRELADLGIREFCNAKTVWVGGSDSGDTSTSRAE